jgi:tetratricopeptide (TPR) repeat protein
MQAQNLSSEVVKTGDSETVLKEKQELEKKIIPKSVQKDKKQKAPFDVDSESETREKNEVFEPAGKKDESILENLPSVNQKDSKTGKIIKNTENSLQTLTELLPKLELIPVKGFAAYLGQTLKLKAKAAPSADEKIPTNLAWVLNGKVVCSGETCFLPLDGTVVGVGTSQLILVAYSSYGSTYTKHVVSVLQGNWNTTLPFSNQYVRNVDSENTTTQETEAAKTIPRMYMIRGNAVHAHPNHISILGSVPRNFLFKGKLKTNQQGVLRIIDNKTGDWFWLPKTDAVFSDKSSRNLNLNRGGIRWHGFSADKSKNVKNETDDVFISTSEILIQPSKGADLYISRTSAPKNKQANEQNSEKNLKNMAFSRVVVISGQAKITVLKTTSGKPIQVNLPTGIEFTIFENGFIQPLSKPNASRIEKVLQLTLTPEEIYEQTQKTEKAASTDINSAITSAQERLKTEDYFEIINILSPFIPRAKENVLVSYLLGLANKGVYQVTKAKKFFEEAINTNTNHTPSYLQLALLSMDEKKWDKAEDYFSILESKIEPNDPLEKEIPYYKGVAQFQQNQDFYARNSFTESLWSDGLDSSLKESAGTFLQTLRKKRNWSLVVPLGVQWDGNPLSLTSNENPPEEFPGKTLARGFLGVIWNYDPATTQNNDGIYLGAGLKGIALKNFPTGFSELDAYVAEASISQTFVSEGNKEDKNSDFSTFKLYQIFSSLWLNKKLSTQGFQLGGIFSEKLYSLDVSIGYEQDTQQKGEESRSAILGRQTISPVVWDNNEGWLVSFDLESNQRFHTNRMNKKGNSVAIKLEPISQISFTNRLTQRFSLFAEYQIEKENTNKKTTTFGAENSINYFLFPWLISSFSVNANYALEKFTNTRKIPKFGGGITFTGLF